MIALTTSVPRVIEPSTHHLAAPADRLHDFRHDRNRPDTLVELAPAVVRHIDDIDVVIGRRSVRPRPLAMPLMMTGIFDSRLIRSMSRQLKRA